MSQTATLILTHGQIHTLDRANPLAEAVAIADGKIVATGSHDRIMSFAAEGTQIVDLKGHTVIPGLNDSHLHLIRGGLNYNLELRWEGVPSLADALRMLKDQADRTPSPQWVRVVGGWSEFQFAERRMPTLEELNEAAPDTPVFVLHLYDRALLNRAALKAVGYSKETPDPAGGEIVRDSHGNPTGMLIAKPNAMILYATLAKGPKLPLDLQLNSTRQFMRELNRLGLTSAIDAGGGFQNYPEDYEIIEQLHAKDQMTVRIAYNLFTQRPKQELEDFERWTDMLKPGQGTDFYRASGSGEMLCSWARDHQIVGTGVDMSLLFSQQAAARAEELGVSDRVTFVHQDASGYVASQPCDVAACVGATWIGGGVAGTIELLKQSLTPGGMLLIGEPWWRKRPATAEEAIACGAQSPDDFLTLPALVAHFGELGYDVVEMVLADQEGWDRYEAAKWLTMRRWLEANPHDDFAPEVRQQLTTAPLHHVTWTREYLGWGVFVLMAR